MNFDDLIPFIFLVGYIGFVFFKKILGKKKDPQKDKPTGKVSFGFSKFINTIKSELIKAANETKLKENQGSAPSQKNIWEELKEDNLAKRDFENEDKTPLENIVRQVPDSAEQSTEPVDESQVDESQKHAYRVHKPQTYTIKKRNRKKKQKTGQRLSVSKLQKAVVWSEILAKPVGLRE
ncbi:MAG: hypothetical protein KAI40_09840 [Desulfobacterales bacterium]|nr:hypothetical protein [Desulfobacterales bacterium]